VFVVKFEDFLDDFVVMHLFVFALSLDLTVLHYNHFISQMHEVNGVSQNTGLAALSMPLNTRWKICLRTCASKKAEMGRPSGRCPCWSRRLGQTQARFLSSRQVASAFVDLGEVTSLQAFEVFLQAA